MNVFKSVGIWIVSGIYKVAAWCFEIFISLSKGNFLPTDKYKLLLENVYVLLGVIILFILAFTLLKSMVNPDDQSKGTATIKKVIINLVTSAIIMALLPTIFTFAYDFQDSIISGNVIPGFFGYGAVGQNSNSTVKNQAYTLVNGVYTAFFNVAEEECNNRSLDISSVEGMQNCQMDIKSKENIDFRNFTSSNGESGKKEKSFFATMEFVNETGRFNMYNRFSKNAAKDEIDFDFLLSLVAAGFLVYVAFSFCFDMGIRLIKLVFYQMIAPFPIFFRIIPEGKLSGVFNNWVKVTLTCYLEVYVRIIVFYFVLFLANLITEQGVMSGVTAGLTGLLPLLAKAFVLMGLVAFMRQAPKLISEVTGLDSGNMKLGIREKLAEGGAFTAASIVGGGLTSGIRNATNAFQKNFERGADGKWKRKDGVTNKDLWKSAGAGFFSSIAGTASGAVRGGKAGWNAKSFKDTKSAIQSGARDATNARDKRANYRAAYSQGNGFWDDQWRVAKGHFSDAKKNITNYVMDESIEGLTGFSNSMQKIYSKYNNFSDTIESLLEKEQSKGQASAFLGNGFEELISRQYEAFDKSTKILADAKLAATRGEQFKYFDRELGEFVTTGADAALLEKLNGYYIKDRDAVRDELMNIALQGKDSAAYSETLNEKGRAVLKDSLVNAQEVQAVILQNASSTVIQEVMGENGTDALHKIVDGENLKVSDFEYTDANGNKVKLKDAAKVAQGQADIKIAEMNKENAAQGDKK